MILGWIKRHMRSKILLILGGLLVGLLCVEAGLRVFEAGPSQHQTDRESLFQQTIPDRKLKIRIAPHALGHDANGFRNDVAPDQTDIVAIGDSQTWGINANRSEAWPQTLARLSGHSTYNMGLGYYNTVEYWVLTEEALQLSPKVVIIGLYFGNDILGAYETVYKYDTHSRFRNSEADTNLFNDTISPQYEVIARQKTDFRPWFDRSILRDLGLPLKERLATFRLLWNSYIELSNWRYRRDEAWAQAYPDYGVVYKNDSICTVLTPVGRLLALDMDVPHIVEGLRISKEMLLLIRNETDTAGVKLLILLIPTKEAVYADAVEKAQGQLTPTYAKLVHMEEQVRTEIILLCKENGIEYVDALPTLEAAVQRNEKIYPSYGDGHPIAAGYFLIASTVNEALDRLDWLE